MPEDAVVKEEEEPPPMPEGAVWVVKEEEEATASALETWSMFFSESRRKGVYAKTCANTLAYSPFLGGWKGEALHAELQLRPDGSGHIRGSKFSGSVEIGGWGPTSLLPYVLRPDDQSKLGSLGSYGVMIHRDDPPIPDGYPATRFFSLEPPRDKPTDGCWTKHYPEGFEWPTFFDAFPHAHMRRLILISRGVPGRSAFEETVIFCCKPSLLPDLTTAAFRHALNLRKEGAEDYENDDDDE